MASGSQNMTTYNARTVTGSNSAASPAGALLLSGEDRANDATGDTWLFLDSAGGTDTPWGIKHDQANNKIQIFGAGTNSVWTEMDTGNTYIGGSLNTGSTLTVRAQDNAHEGGEIILSPATDSFSTAHIDAYDSLFRLHDGTNESFKVNVSTGNATINGNLGIGTDYAVSGGSYKLYVNGSTYFNGDTTHNGIDYFANGTTYYINNSADGYLNNLQLKTNLTFDSIGGSETTGTSGKITWSGSTDAADIYYYVPASDQGNLVFNTRDDTNCLLAFAYNGTIKAYINNSTPSVYPQTTNTGTIGTTSYEWGTTYTRAIYARHFDASYSFTSDRNMYYGYNKADNHYFYTMDGTTRTHRATINATGLFINQPATNRNAGIIGSYDYTKAALIWSMGASYNIAANGSGLGSLYGAAYGYGGQAYLGSKPLAGGHQFIWCENGVPQVALGNTGVWIKKNGGIKWDPYVESATDASDVTQIIQVASGAAGGTELRIQQANDATDIINLVTPKSIYLNSKEAFNVSDAWLRINENKKFTSGVYFGSSVVRTDGEFWSDSVRIVDNWVGFYNAVQGSTRYGYIQANANRMYFRKENGVSSYHFDFGGHIYTPNNVYAHGIWANQSDGEKQVGVDNGTAGTLYLWSNSSEKGIFSSTGYRTGYIVRVTSRETTFYGNCTGSSASCTGNANTANYQNCVANNEIRYARNGNMKSANDLWQGWAFAEGKVAVINGWRFGNGNGGLAPIYGSKVYNAVWNDFAEYRVSDITEGGRVLVSDGKGHLILSTERLQPSARVISDTFGCSVGMSDSAKTPIGVAGRVLVFPYQPRENYKVGDALCAAPNGTADIMTREEIIQFPDRIIGIVDEIPDYEIWDQIHTNKKDDGEVGEQNHTNIEVKGRIWIYVR